MEAVEVDGVARVFGVPLFQVLGVAGQEVLQPVAVDDEVFHGGRATGGGFESAASVRGLPSQSWRRSSQTQG